MSVTVFYTSVSCSVVQQKNQTRILSILHSKRIPFKTVDISQNENDKILMREMAGDPMALAPQICNGNVYCGDFLAFENAIEEDNLNGFLGI